MSGPGARTRALAAAVVAVAVASAPAGAWLTGGHRRVTLDAVALLPAEVPGFFRAGAATVARASVDPDLWRNRGTPALADRVAPEHFLDLERLRGEPLPERRPEFLRLVARLGVAPQEVGFLPYAIVEAAERLALAFAEHRRWPDDEAVRAKCLIVAGWLAHYAADLEQPLHTTIHHDGRALSNGESPRTGFHRVVDALFDRVPPRTELRLAAAPPKAIRELWPAVERELLASHRRVDELYALEPALRLGEAAGDPRVEALAVERYRATARFVSGMLLWGWERSAELELPDWLER